ncbi:MAG: 30S ribosomal protein S4 [Aigarchaeota archaeon]|nr:30S ribosomal protein S4 [Aigarchaeota archaeon]MCX8192927.1 30S ribosomal protein S4 [Nitrososphaeria archaeon]MDW7986428.1 30S ribosomal protein S4 [Nitrososphaerota archaeon]
MGDPKRPRKQYETPKHPWKSDRLSMELQLLGEYGLRNKRELWRAETILRKIRAQARSLFILTGEKRVQEEKRLIQRLYKMGLVEEEATADDVLKLTIRDILERRLQTIVFKLGYAKSIYQARQLITHGHVYIRDSKVRSPSYHVMRGEESQIKVAVIIEAK